MRARSEATVLWQCVGSPGPLLMKMPSKWCAVPVYRCQLSLRSRGGLNAKTPRHTYQLFRWDNRMGNKSQSSLNGFQSQLAIELRYIHSSCTHHGQRDCALCFPSPEWKGQNRISHIGASFWQETPLEDSPRNRSMRHAYLLCLS